MSKNFETLIAKVTICQSNLEAATAALNEALTIVEAGHVVTIGNLPYHVVVTKGEKQLRPMLTKRQVAAMQGTPLPPIQRRKRQSSEAES
jgi:hypothetical protein